MNGNDAIRHRVLDVIRTGKLPYRAPSDIWAGPGCGACCVICFRQVNADEVEYELDFAGGTGERHVHHLHRDCFLTWESERRALESKLGASPITELSAALGDANLAVNDRETPGSQGPPG